MNRRRFLALLGSAAVVPVLPAVAEAAPTWVPPMREHTADAMRYAFPAYDYQMPYQAMLNAQARAIMDAMARGTGVVRAVTSRSTIGSGRSSLSTRTSAAGA